MVTVAIGDMTIEESVDFNGATSGGGPVLIVNSLVIDPADGEVTVTFNEFLVFLANDP